MAATKSSITLGFARNSASDTDNTSRLQHAAERLRRAGLDADERGHVRLANLCWRKRVEALNILGLIAAEDARRQHQYRGRRMERLF